MMVSRGPVTSVGVAARELGSSAQQQAGLCGSHWGQRALGKVYNYTHKKYMMMLLHPRSRVYLGIPRPSLMFAKKLF